MSNQTKQDILSCEDGRKVLEIELPLPPRACSPNVKGHVFWTIARAAAVEHKADAIRIGKPLFVGHAQSRVTISTEWFMGLTPSEKMAKQARAKGATAKEVKKIARARYRPNDIQNANASLKAAIDGLCDAGMAPSDNHRWVDWGKTVLHRTKQEHKGRSCVVLRLEFGDPFYDGKDRKAEGAS